MLKSKCWFRLEIMIKPLYLFIDLQAIKKNCRRSGNPLMETSRATLLSQFTSTTIKTDGIAEEEWTAAKPSRSVASR